MKVDIYAFKSKGARDGSRGQVEISLSQDKSSIELYASLDGLCDQGCLVDKHTAKELANEILKLANKE